VWSRSGETVLNGSVWQALEESEVERDEESEKEMSRERDGEREIEREREIEMIVQKRIPRLWQNA